MSTPPWSALHPLRRALLAPSLAFAVVIALTSQPSAIPLFNNDLPSTQQTQQPQRADPRVKEAIAAGLAAFNKGDLNASQAAFSRAAQLAPKEPVPLLGLAQIADSRGNKEEAAANLKKALELGPKSPIVLVAYARFLLESKDYRGAVARLDEAIQFYPGSAVLYREKGDIYAAPLNDPVNAITAYRQAVAIDNKDAAAHYALGFALNRVGKFAEAKVELTSATTLTPANALAWTALGTVHLNIGEYRQAQTAFETAVKLQPKLWGAHLGRGDAFAGQNLIKEATAAYNEAMRLDSRSTLPHLRIGVMLEQTGQLAEAEQHYRAALSINGTDPEVLNDLAFLLAERKTNLDEALLRANMATKLAPAVLIYQDTLAWVYRARGELDPALRILKRIAAATPNPDFEYHLGVVYSERKMNQEAIAAFDRALKLVPAYRPAREARERLAGPG